MVTREEEGQTIEMATESLVATRYKVRYAKQLRVVQSDQTTDAGGRHAMVLKDERRDLEAWKQIPPEVRSECEKVVDYIVVATAPENTYTVKMQVDDVEVAVCDPCLLGGWSLQLDTFGEMLRTGMASAGTPMPPGTSFEFVGGEYLVAFDDEGKLTEQRDALAVRVGQEGVGSLDLAIDSFAAGDYTADGENITATDIVEDYARVSFSIPGMGGFGIGGSSVFTFSGDTTGGAGTYECNRDNLTITVESFSPIVWDRVDRIPEPENTVP
jgi:hypothetical protein